MEINIGKESDDNIMVMIVRMLLVMSGTSGDDSDME